MTTTISGSIGSAWAFASHQVCARRASWAPARAAARAPPLVCRSPAGAPQDVAAGRTRYRNARTSGPEAACNTIRNRNLFHAVNAARTTPWPGPHGLSHPPSANAYSLSPPVQNPVYISTPCRPLPVLDQAQGYNPPNWLSHRPPRAWSRALAQEPRRARGDDATAGSLADRGAPPRGTTPTTTCKT